jgi:hypothetical protein
MGLGGWRQRPAYQEYCSDNFENCIRCRFIFCCCKLITKKRDLHECCDLQTLLQGCTVCQLYGSCKWCLSLLGWSGGFHSALSKGNVQGEHNSTAKDVLSAHPLSFCQNFSHFHLTSMFISAADFLAGLIDKQSMSINDKRCIL